MDCPQGSRRKQCRRHRPGGRRRARTGGFLHGQAQLVVHLLHRPAHRGRVCPGHLPPDVLGQERQQRQGQGVLPHDQCCGRRPATLLYQGDRPPRGPVAEVLRQLLQPHGDSRMGTVQRGVQFLDDFHFDVQLLAGRCQDRNHGHDGRPDELQPLHPGRQRQCRQDVPHR